MHIMFNICPQTNDSGPDFDHFGHTLQKLIDHICK